MARQGKREYVTFKSVRLPYYPYEDRGKAYWRFAYPDESVKGGWRYGTRSTKKDAKEAAHTKAVEIANGVLDLSNLAPDQARLARAFLDLNPTWEDITAMKEKKAALNITLRQGIKAFMDFKISEKGKLTVHLNKTQSKLNKLADHFGEDAAIHTVLAPQLTTWLLQLKLEPKTTNAYRAAAVSMWRWLAKQDMIQVTGNYTEIEKTANIEIGNKEVGILTPDEMKFVLENVTDEFLPWAVIAAFSGIRTGEILGDDKPPMTSLHIKLDQDLFDIPAEISKNRKRKLIPILPTLKAWLEHLKLDGQIITTVPNIGETKRLGQLMDKHFKQEKGWMHNVLRHSYGSYRVADTKDVAATSLEMDNSPEVIKKHYLEATTEKEAKAYFGLTPSDVSRMQ